MKTIGEIITSARLHQDLTPEDVSKLTKIDVKYINALEHNRFDLLPSPTFTKGFIRNIALSLGRKPEELIAVYRRDQTNPSKLPSPAKGRVALTAGWGLNRSTLLFLSAAFFIFFGYLAFQYRALLVPPPLSISRPAAQAVLTSPLTIEGRTSPDSLVTIEPETDLKPDSSGIFITTLSLSPGDHNLTITATNRFGRSASKTLSLTVISSD